MKIIRKVIDREKLKDLKIPSSYGPKVEVVILPIRSNKQKTEFNPCDFEGTTNFKNVENDLKQQREGWERF